VRPAPYPPHLHGRTEMPYFQATIFATAEPNASTNASGVRRARHTRMHAGNVSVRKMMLVEATAQLRDRSPA